VSLVEQEPLTFPEHLGSTLFLFSSVHVAQSLVFYVVFCRSLFVLFLLAIVLSVFLFTASVSFGHCDLCPSIYRFGIFWPLWSLSFDLLLLYLLVIVFSVLRFIPSVYVGHCDLCPSFYSFCLFWPLWSLSIVL
jgi:hypothetical protein